jgi:BirA family biotin operon repressor/biotin-[acetyl-CoA-carboxylase] ligase
MIFPCPAFTLHVVEECPSTNEALLARRDQPDFSGYCLLARRQTGGLGRRGRSWWGGEGNLALSLAFRFEEPVAPVPLLPFVAGVSAARLLRPLLPPGADLRLKWPNDIYLEGRKLAGMLAQARQVGAVTDIVLGIGLNLATAPEGMHAIALAERAAAPDPVDFARAFLREIELDLRELDFPALRERWEREARLADTELEIVGSGERVRPLALLATGELEVRALSGESRRLAAEEVSLRLAD